MALSAASVAALSFSPGVAELQRHAVLPALGRAAVAPAMLLEATTSFLADAAILLDDPAAAATAATSAAAAATEEVGWFGTVVVKPFEFAIESLHGALAGAGLSEAWGPSIIIFTLILKLSLIHI